MLITGVRDRHPCGSYHDEMEPSGLSDEIRAYYEDEIDEDRRIRHGLGELELSGSALVARCGSLVRAKPAGSRVSSSRLRSK